MGGKRGEREGMGLKMEGIGVIMVGVFDSLWLRKRGERERERMGELGSQCDCSYVTESVMCA